MLDILPTVPLLIVLGRRSFGVFERSRGEDGAVGEGSAFVLTIGAVTDCRCDWLALAFKLDCSAHT